MRFFSRRLQRTVKLYHRIHKSNSRPFQFHLRRRYYTRPVPAAIQSMCNGRTVMTVVRRSAATFYITNASPASGRSSRCRTKWAVSSCRDSGAATTIRCTWRRTIASAWADPARSSRRPQRARSRTIRPELAINSLRSMFHGSLCISARGTMEGVP